MNCIFMTRNASSHVSVVSQYSVNSTKLCVNILRVTFNLKAFSAKYSSVGTVYLARRQDSAVGIEARLRAG